MLNIYNLNVEETFLTEFVIRQLPVENIPFCKMKYTMSKRTTIEKIFKYLIVNKKRRRNKEKKEGKIDGPKEKRKKE